jgi:hypothetical protein
MLDATTPAFQQQYPNGAIVRDRTGRRIANVIACNPETGEAITYDTSGLTQALLRLVQLNSPKAWRLRLQGARVSWQEGSYGVFSKSNHQLLRRHGFWPAPLTIRANMPPPPRHPMCKCVFVPLRPATEADLPFAINEPLPEVAWRSLVTGETVTIKGVRAPHDHFNDSYTVSSVSHNTIPAID